MSVLDKRIRQLEQANAGLKPQVIYITRVPGDNLSSAIITCGGGSMKRTDDESEAAFRARVEVRVKARDATDVYNNRVISQKIKVYGRNRDKPL